MSRGNEKIPKFVKKGATGLDGRSGRHNVEIRIHPEKIPSRVRMTR